MSMFLRPPDNAKHTKVLINLSQVQCVSISRDPDNFSVRFRVRGGNQNERIDIIAIYFDTKEEAEEWFEYISELITTN